MTATPLKDEFILEELKDIYPALIEDYMVPNFPIYELID